MHGDCIGGTQYGHDDVLERMSRRLKGEPVDRPPNFDIFMTFAARRTGRPLREYYLDYRVLVEANLRIVEDFDTDIAQAISDPYRECHDFGAEIEFPPDDLPLCRTPLLAELDDIKRCSRPAPTRGSAWAIGWRPSGCSGRRWAARCPSWGGWKAPWRRPATCATSTTSCWICHRAPERVEELLEICVEVEIAFAKAQVEAGADIIGLGDAVASLVNPKMYRRFALPYEQRIFAAVHEMGALCRLHICGNTNRIVDDMVESGADIIDLDWMVDMGAAAAKYGDRVSFCGNFDPVAVMLRARPSRSSTHSVHCMKIGGARSSAPAAARFPCTHLWRTCMLNSRVGGFTPRSPSGQLAPMRRWLYFGWGHRTTTDSDKERTEIATDCR